jgi:hypothetical protein
MAAEPFTEQLSRVHLMSEDDGQTWDLSRNDQAALTALIMSHAELLSALRQLSNEAAGFLSMADPFAHGNTNIAVLSERISEARAAIAKTEER